VHLSGRSQFDGFLRTSIEEVALFGFKGIVIVSRLQAKVGFDSDSGKRI